MKPITIWTRYTKQKDGTYKWEHNHIEDELIRGIEPIPNCEFQCKAWKDAQWRRCWGYLNVRNKVITFI